MIISIKIKPTRVNEGGEFVEMKFARTNPQHEHSHQARTGNQPLIGWGSLHMNRKGCDELLAILQRGDVGGMVRVEHVTTFKDPQKVAKRMAARGEAPR